MYNSVDCAHPSIRYSAFEQLIRRHGNAARCLPLESRAYGQNTRQLNLVGADWHTKRLLLSARKWMGEPINRGVVRGFVENKMPKVLSDMSAERDEWSVHTPTSVVTGLRITDAAHKEATQTNVLMIDLDRLDTNLALA